MPYVNQTLLMLINGSLLDMFFVGVLCFVLVCCVVLSVVFSVAIILLSRINELVALPKLFFLKSCGC